MMTVGDTRVELETAPFIENGALFNLLPDTGKVFGSVYWDERGVIVVSALQSSINGILMNDANLDKVVEQLS